MCIFAMVVFHIPFLLLHRQAFSIAFTVQIELMAHMDKNEVTARKLFELR